MASAAHEEERQVKALKIFIVLGILFLAASGCAFGPNAQGGAVGGAAVGGLLGLGIGSLSGVGGPGAAIGAATGALIGGALGSRQDQTTAVQQTQAAAMGIENCDWVYDHLGNRRWSCSGNITRGRLHGPPVDPFPLPPPPPPFPGGTSTPYYPHHSPPAPTTYPYPARQIPVFYK